MIAVFYHCMPSPLGIEIANEQTDMLRRSGLLAAANFVLFGVNGASRDLSRVSHLIPAKAQLALHGPESRSENATIVEIEKWVKGKQGWNVLYFHTKGASRSLADTYSKRWRDCMMRHAVANWKACVADLENGFETAGVHWVRGADATQNYYAGNFWWAKSEYLNTLPSIFERARIKRSGLKSAESRYEAEVWIGNGPRLPKRKDYHPGAPSASH